MFPNNEFSSVPVPQDLRLPKDLDRYRGIASDLGPVALGSDSEGLFSYQWWLTYDPETSDFILIREGQEPQVILNVPDVVDLEYDVSFDTAGRVFITWQSSTGVMIYWYDPIEAGFRQTLRAPGGTTPFCTLDIRTPFKFADADIVLCYERDNAVYFRLTKDRYTIEYPTPIVDLGRRRIQQAGLGANLRYTIKVS